MKYIVYKTVNTVNNNFYIGVHKTNPEKFDGYLGDGIYINKPDTYKFSKTNLQIAVNTFGTRKFKRETLAVFDLEKDALEMERALVTPEVLAKPTTYNMLLGEIDPTAKIYIYKLTGEFVEESNIKKSAYKLYASCSEVYKAAVLGCQLNGYQVLLVKADNYAEAKTSQTKTRKVYKYSFTGEFMEEYNSQVEACEKNKYSNVAKCIKTKLHCKNGFFWGLEKLDRYNVYKTPSKVIKYDLEGNLIAYYKSFKACRIANHLPKLAQFNQSYGDYYYKCI